MASAWGKSWGKAFGSAWGTISVTPPTVPGSPGLAGWPVRIPQPRYKRTRRTRERSDLFLIGTK